MQNKFRVWDKRSEEYLSGSELDEAYINSDGDLCINRWDDLYQHYRMTVYDMPCEYYTVEFFTGFSDKNGREIYEGDMLKRKHEFGVVQFVNGQWVIMRGGILLGSVAYQADEFEIIGTVHDNSSEKANSSEVDDV